MFFTFEICWDEKWKMRNGYDGLWKRSSLNCRINNGSIDISLYPHKSRLKIPDVNGSY